MSKKSLYQALKEYSAGDSYPFHMPGHKRRLAPMEEPGVYEIDITEIEGFDNLHHAMGILKESQERAAKLYGADETHFLVNGSTSGILSAVSGCTQRGGSILMARNCHKAAWHAAELRDLHVHYVYPAWDSVYGINGSISPRELRAALNECSVQAVMITSPTYDGVVSDLKGIADVVHEHGLPLIVDEAHGAHFGFHNAFPSSAVKLGADVVIQSLHKTMPCLTQTALIHLNGERIDREKIRKYLGIYQTSSPSYVLMAAMDSCIRYIEESGRERFKQYAQELLDLRGRLGAELKNIRLLGTEELCPKPAFALDPSKLILAVPSKDGQLRGKWLMDSLRESFGLELEMAAGGYALAMTGPGDEKEGFERLEAALRAMDADMSELTDRACERSLFPPIPTGQTVWPPGGTENRPTTRIPLTEAGGRVSGEYIYLYPPGIPLAVPGERIAVELPGMLAQYVEAGFHLEGLSDEHGRTVCIIVE